MKNANQINALQNIIIETITPLINSDFALLDVPEHNNIGDNLIWKGELDYFSTLKHSCVYEYSLWYKLDYKKLDSTHIFLFHGGGNFGDFYKLNQEFRLQIIQSYKDKRIIVLPQSVYYKNIQNLKSDAEIMNQHPDLHIMVRDKESFDLLNQYLECKVYLVPDMAFCMDRSYIDKFRIKNLTNSKKGLYMKRKDSELASNEIQFSEFDVLDWPTFNYGRIKRGLVYRRERYNRILSNKLIDLGLGNIVDSRFGLKPYNQMNRYIKKGVRFMDKYESIYTTRLHGLVLAILLEKEVYIIDNKLHKLTRFYDQWLTDFEDVHIYKP